MKKLILISTICLLMISCSKQKYPDSYGVYTTNGTQRVERRDINDNFVSGVDFYNQPNITDNNSVSLWFYDPKIVPTELNFGHISNYNHVENLAFKVKPIEDRSGLYKIDIVDNLMDGIYFLYPINYQSSSIPDIQWPLVVGNRISKDKYKEQIIDKWKSRDSGELTFNDNGTLIADEEVLKFRFMNDELFIIKSSEHNSQTAKILFMTENIMILLIGGEYIEIVER